jgi:hypothetical protein
MNIIILEYCSETVMARAKCYAEASLLVSFCYLLRSSRKRGHGAAMEILDGQSTVTPRDGRRREVLSWPTEDQTEQGADSGSVTILHVRLPLRTPLNAVPTEARWSKLDL